MTYEKSKLDDLARRYAIETGLILHDAGCDLSSCSCEYVLRLARLETALRRFGQVMYFEGTRDVFDVLTTSVSVNESTQESLEGAVAHD